MKNNINKLLLILSVILLFNSCIGMAIDIQMNNDGSGKLFLEYRISRILDGIGRLDGNESMPIIPAGRQDIERTIQRIPGMKLLSYSNRQTEKDIIIGTNIEFNSPQALLAFLDPSGNRASITNNGQSGIFELIIYNEGSALNKFDENLMELMPSFFAGYDFTINFSAPGSSAMIITDADGNSISAPLSSVTTVQGRRVSLSMGVLDVITLSNGLGIKINW